MPLFLLLAASEKNTIKMLNKMLFADILQRTELDRCILSAATEKHFTTCVGTGGLVQAFCLLHQPPLA